ncbi:unnamed protein product, partial [Ilex paraguariensis]
MEEENWQRDLCNMEISGEGKKLVLSSANDRRKAMVRDKVAGRVFTVQVNLCSEML